MNKIYTNIIIYSVVLVMSITFMACLDSDNLSNILSQVRIEDGEGLIIGTTAPAFSLPDADDNTRSLSEFAGQKVVVVFFATEG